MPAALLAMQGWWAVLAVINQHNNSIINSLVMIVTLAIRCAGSADYFPLTYSARVSLYARWGETE